MNRSLVRARTARSVPAQPLPAEIADCYPLLQRLRFADLCGLCAITNCRPPSDCLSVAVRLEISQRAALAAAAAARQGKE